MPAETIKTSGVGVPIDASPSAFVPAIVTQRTPISRVSDTTPAILRFQAVTVPAAAQGNPSIDGTGVRMIVPTAQAFASQLYLGDALIAGTIPKRVLSASFHLVDLQSSAVWTSAVMSVRRANAPNGVFVDYSSALTLAKSTTFASVGVDDLDSAFLGLVWTTGESSAIPNALEIWVHLNGD